MFQTKITRARFVMSPFSSEAMARIAQAGMDSVKARILRAENVDDAPAKPLKPGRNGHKGYPERKIAHGRAPIRDWYRRGKTLGSMKVLQANENRAVGGFADAESDMIAHVNNLREKQFGISPKDRVAVQRAAMEELRGHQLIQVRKTA